MNLELLFLVLLIIFVFYLNYLMELRNQKKKKQIKERMLLEKATIERNRQARQNLPEISQLVFTPSYSSIEQYGSRPVNQRVIKSNYLAKKDRSPEFYVYNSMSYKQFQN